LWYICEIDKLLPEVHFCPLTSHKPLGYHIMLNKNMTCVILNKKIKIKIKILKVKNLKYYYFFLKKKEKKKRKMDLIPALH
jgi:hypothetical protein